MREEKQVTPAPEMAAAVRAEAARVAAAGLEAAAVSVAVPVAAGTVPTPRPSPVEIVTVNRGTLARTTHRGRHPRATPHRRRERPDGRRPALRERRGGQLRPRGTDRSPRSTRASSRRRSRARRRRSSSRNPRAKRSDELWKQRIITALEYERDRASLAAAQATLDQLKMRQRLRDRQSTDQRHHHGEAARDRRHCVAADAPLLGGRHVHAGVARDGLRARGAAAQGRRGGGRVASTRSAARAFPDASAACSRPPTR